MAPEGNRDCQWPFLHTVTSGLRVQLEYHGLSSAERGFRFLKFPARAAGLQVPELALQLSAVTIIMMALWQSHGRYRDPRGP